MKPVEPVIVVDLFPDERAELLALLTSFSDEDWAKPTVCPGWTAKDIALHLLGDEVSILSRSRDGFQYGQASFEGDDFWDELVAWLNQRNQAWVESARHISPRLLCELLSLTGNGVYEYFKALDPHELGGPVTWAGPAPAPKWLDIAREYTERWVHHQQIRDAVGVAGLKDKRFFAPVLDTFVRALPHTYSNVEADKDTTVNLNIVGDAGGQWALANEGASWILYKGSAPNPTSKVTLDQETAWRLFTKGISKEDALAEVVIEGDYALGFKILDVVAIIA